MKTIIKLAISAAPAIWNLLDKSTKIVLTTLAFVIVIGYTGLVFWATVRLEAISAFDERWHLLDDRASQERNENMREIRQMMSTIKNDQNRQTDEIKELRNVLMTRYK